MKYSSKILVKRAVQKGAQYVPKHVDTDEYLCVN